jgi:gluconolactonase
MILPAQGDADMRVRVAAGALSAAIATAIVTVNAQTPTSLQAPNDPRYADVIAKCKTPPQRAGGPPPAAAPGGGRAAAPAPAPAATAAEYTVAAIPGVIAAGQRWTTVYQTTGNNADGIMAAEDGGLLIAQNDNAVVLKLDAKGQASPLHRDTNTGGALSRSPKGALFVVSRGINTSILQLEPQRRVFANSLNGEPLECLGGVINDLTTDSKGGAYFTMGGVFHADPTGKVTSYGQNLRTNGVILSPDERTLYVTNGQVVVAFDVRQDGTLANQRDFAKLPAGGGDGLAVDAAGRLYVTAGGGGGGASGVFVFAADGKLLGNIPSPRPLITAAFAGKDKKTLYAVANDRRTVEVYAIPMLAEGPKNRAK